MPDSIDLLTSCPFRVETARKAGWTRKELERRVHDGRLLRLRRGVLVARAVYEAADSSGQHALRVQAQQLVLDDTCASHGSAATVYALPVRWPLLRVELTSPTVRPRDRSDLRLHRAPLPDHHRALHRGTLPVTSPARTVADCARTQSLRDALVVADAALDRGLTTPEELSSIVAELKGWPAAPSCGRVLALARVAESPGETLLRVDLLDLGFADVVTQARVRGASGRRYRVDLLLPSLGAIGEFDGAVKYGGLDGQPGTDVLAREKQREDDLRLAGWGVFRVTWQELGNLALLRRKLEHAALLSRRAARPA